MVSIPSKLEGSMAIYKDSPLVSKIDRRILNCLLVVEPRRRLAICLCH